jgi:hypothetical protein
LKALVLPLKPNILQSSRHLYKLYQIYLSKQLGDTSNLKTLVFLIQDFLKLPALLLKSKISQLKFVSGSSLPLPPTGLLPEMI